MKLILGDCLDVLKTLDPSTVSAVVSDPPYGMKWNTDSTRFTGGMRGEKRRLEGRSDHGHVHGDSKAFDASPWLQYPKVILFGSNHYSECLPVGTTLVWIKKNDSQFGNFLSDAEVAYMKGGHGVYCYRKPFPASSRAKESGSGKVAHACQKPVALMKWCIEKLKLKPGSTIFDPYMGSGTTGVAAVEMGFDFIGCEIDKTHYATAKRRINAAMKAHETTPQK